MTAAVPDPRFRDQLAEWFHGGWCTDDHVDGDGDPWCAQQASDLMSLIAAHVEAEAQAAVNHLPVKPVVLIAASVADGHDWLAGQPAPPPAVIVTPRSKDAARGVEGLGILATPAGASHPRYDELLAVSLPSIATALASPARRGGGVMATDAATTTHCPTCVCGRRAPVQASYESRDRPRKPAGTVAWWEHEKAWEDYGARYRGQSAERIRRATVATE